MQDNNRIVQGLWVGGRLTELERLCIRSFCAHGHIFHLYHYDELQNLPQADGLHLLNAEEILPHTKIFRHKGRTLAFFADQFRWELLRQRGGWWVDMDMVCVRPLDFAADVVFCRDCRPKRMHNCFIKFPRGHFLAATLADAYSNINRIQPWDGLLMYYRKTTRRLMFWRDSRPHITSKDAGGMSGFMFAVKHFGLESHIHTPLIYMLPEKFRGQWYTKNAGWNFERLLSAAPSLRCLHLCNSFFGFNGIDKDGEFPADSLYEVLKRRYPEPGK